MSEHWQIVKCLINAFANQEDGRFALVKLPYKPVLKLFKIPEI